MKKENVLVVSKEELNRHFNLQREFWSVKKSDIDALQSYYVPRSLAESDFNAKQLIPYAVISDAEGRYLTYNRHGSERRLKGVFSVGIGGHVNDGDKSDGNYNTLIAGLEREVTEEIGIRLVGSNISLMGMINEDVSEVGHCHIGIVFKAKLMGATPSFDAEIENPQWLTMQDIDLGQFELWSSLALKLVCGEEKLV